MEIRHLKLVKAIVEQGSIANAIDELHLTASALSYQLKEAEQQLGTPIFLRVNKKLVLTAAGHEVYNTAVSILKELNQLSNNVKEVQQGRSGTIRLSVQYYTTWHWLPAVISRFHESFPNIDVRVVFAENEIAMEELRGGSIDLLLTCMQTEKHPVTYATLFKDEMVALTPDNDYWRSKTFAAADDFRDANLIVHARPEKSDVLYTEVLQPAGITPRSITVLPLADAALAMIRSGMGVSVMTRTAVQSALTGEDIRVLPVTAHGLFKYQYAAMLHQEHMPPYLDAFIRHLSFSSVKPAVL
ncbi:LysR family transcriptional regulator [Chitinophaga solisilvae]|uniref:LysR family transcriptional regulator n=1 Tax=Chitinophaga solisilvae TaxID=1233460 RepID=UPI00136D6546|nr:LysR family transcriptional regulator [Chitinophaga solisilvae]